MTEKVIILTQEQADDVERLKELYEHYSDGYRNLQLIQEKLNGNYQREDEDIKEANNIPDENFINLLHYGYEVEMEFGVGDWVVIKLDGEIKKITGITFALGIDGDVCCFNLDGSGMFIHSEIRHATESEITKEEKRRTNKIGFTKN